MGCLFSKEQKSAKDRNKQIENKLQEDRENSSKDVKLLLLGL